MHIQYRTAAHTLLSLLKKNRSLYFQPSANFNGLQPTLRVSCILDFPNNAGEKKIIKQQKPNSMVQLTNSTLRIAHLPRGPSRPEQRCSGPRPVGWQPRRCTGQRHRCGSHGSRGRPSPGRLPAGGGAGRCGTR